MGEALTDVLADRVGRVMHVHLSDNPGRHEPGTGAIRWREGLAWLRANGYRGHVGLEYRPRGATLAGLGFLDAT
jgi:hydroxypyruvate isomerase